MDFFEGLVARSGGLYPGQCQYDGFVALAPATEVKRQSGLLNILDDEAALARYREFENWFRYTQDLPGDFYLWLVRELFIANKLIAGELVLGGATVDLARISCPTFMLAGATDHITPPTQLFALADHISTPARDQLVLTAPGGHLGLFMGHAALHDYWPTLLAEVARRS
jgi:poly(3-hydroxyalkanoate) synthetase